MLERGTSTVDIFARTSAALTFPSTTAGTASAAQTVVFENAGNAALSISVPASGQNPAIVGPYAYGNSSTCPQISSMATAQSLAPAATCTQVITFNPTAGGTSPGTVTTSDTSNNAPSTQVVSLTGTSPTPTTTLSFIQGANASTTVGSNTTFTVQVTNNGTPITAGTVSFTTTVNSTTYNIGSAAISGNYQFTYNAAYAGANTITATFTPTDSTAYSSSSASTPLTVSAATPNQINNTNDQTVQNSVATTLTIILAYPGSVAPTGAVTVKANGNALSGLGTPTCVAKVKHMNCGYPYTSTLTAGTYTLTYTLAADSNYNASTGTSTLTVTAPPAGSGKSRAPITTHSPTMMR